MKLIYSLSALFLAISAFFILDVSASSPLALYSSFPPTLEYDNIRIFQISYTSTMGNGQCGFLYSSDAIIVGKSLFETPIGFLDKKSKLGKPTIGDILIEMSSGKLAITPKRNGKKMPIFLTRNGVPKKVIISDNKSNPILKDGDIVTLIFGEHYKRIVDNNVILPMSTGAITLSFEKCFKAPEESSLVRVLSFQVKITQKTSSKKSQKDQNLPPHKDWYQPRSNLLVKSTIHETFHDDGFYFNVIGLPNLRKNFDCEFESLQEDIFKDPFLKISISLNSINIEHQLPPNKSKNEVEWSKCLTKVCIVNNKLNISHSHTSLIKLWILRGKTQHRVSSNQGALTAELDINDQLFITYLKDDIDRTPLNIDHVEPPKDWSDTDLEKVGLNLFNSKIIAVNIKFANQKLANTVSNLKQQLRDKKILNTISPSNTKTSTTSSKLEKENSLTEKSTKKSNGEDNRPVLGMDLESEAQVDMPSSYSDSDSDSESPLSQQIDLLTEKFKKLLAGSKRAKIFKKNRANNKNISGRRNANLVESMDDDIGMNEGEENFVFNFGPIDNLTSTETETLTSNQNQLNNTNNDQSSKSVELVNERNTNKDYQPFMFGFGSLEDLGFAEAKSLLFNQNQPNNVNDDQKSNPIKLVDDKNTSIDQQTLDSTFSSDNTPIFGPSLPDFEFVHEPINAGNSLVKQLDLFFEKLKSSPSINGELTLKKRGNK